MPGPGARELRETPERNAHHRAERDEKRRDPTADGLQNAVIGTASRLTLSLTVEFHRPDVVAGIPVRILLQVILVVILGRPELLRRNDLRHDRTLPRA